MAKNQDNSPGLVKSGYITKKGTPSGEGAMFNKLPPGQYIEKQSVSDVNRTNNMPMKKVTPLGYS